MVKLEGECWHEEEIELSGMEETEKNKEWETGGIWASLGKCDHLNIYIYNIPYLGRQVKGGRFRPSWLQGVHMTLRDKVGRIRILKERITCSKKLVAVCERSLSLIRPDLAHNLLFNHSFVYCFSFVFFLNCKLYLYCVAHSEWIKENISSLLSFSFFNSLISLLFFMFFIIHTQTIL